MKISSGGRVKVDAEQLGALAALPDTISALDRSLAGLAETAARLEAVAERIDRSSAPILALAPRLELLTTLLDAELISAIRASGAGTQIVAQTQEQVEALAASMEQLKLLMQQNSARRPEAPVVATVTTKAPAKRATATGRPGSRMVED